MWLRSRGLPYFTCLFLVLSISNKLSAQSTFVLHVISQTNDQPIEGANVAILNSDNSGSSDKNGRVELTDIPGGVHIVSISSEGYQSETMVLNIREGGAVNASISLTAQLDEVIVTADRVNRKLEILGFYERKEKGFGTFITSEEIEKKGKLKLTEALRGITGIHLKRMEMNRWEGEKLVAVSGRSGTGPDGAIMSAKPCPLRLYVDGTYTGEEIPNLDQLVTLGDVAAIEVYKGPAGLPSRFSQFNACGAIVIWTKTGKQE